MAIIGRVFRRILRRVARRTCISVLRATCDEYKRVAPAGCTLIRVSGMTPKRDFEFVENAMQAVGEPCGLVAPRLRHGDEFFGWLTGGEVVSFGWVTYRDRKVGPVQLAEMPGRAFLYNFHTLEAQRGRGLYPALLGAMRSILGRESVSELIIDVNTRNTASMRGIEKAGFLSVAQIGYLTIFNGWWNCFKRIVIDSSGPSPIFMTEPS